MSLLKTGYFTLLPPDLRGEFKEYYLDYTTSLTILEAFDTFETLVENKKKITVLPQDFLINFDIIINLGRNKIAIMFSCMLASLSEFLKRYISEGRFVYITPNNLLPLVEWEENVQPATREKLNRYKRIASEGRLINQYRRVNLYLDICYYYNENDTIELKFDAEDPITLCALDRLQSEILMYKLVEFYNDLVGVSLPQNNIKGVY